MSFNLQESLVKKATVISKLGFSDALLLWYQSNKESHPWRTNWEKFASPYHVWVSEIMLQQTMIKVVIPLYIRFIKKFPTIQSLAGADTKELQQYVKGLGYYNRFDRLHKAAQFLCEPSRPFVWPRLLEEWKKIPGVGEYTASALSSICFGEPEVVVDGNVERVFSRLFYITEEINSYAMKKTLRKMGLVLLCQKNPGDFNQGLMELGQKVCLKANPLCNICPLSKHCLALKKNKVSELPLVKKNKRSVLVQLDACIFEKRGKVFLEQRDNSAKFLKNRLGFPLLEKKPKKGELLGSFSHQITHHKIKVEVTKLIKHSPAEKIKGQWIVKKDLSANIVSSLDQKILQILDKTLV